MHRLLTTFFAAPLGGVCSTVSNRAAVATEGHAGAHGHAGPHCDNGGAGMHHGFADADALTKVFDDPARDEWQRPDDVLRALQLAPEMTVADIGAGTGYFAVRLARAVPAGEVIAADVEPDMVVVAKAPAN